MRTSNTGRIAHLALPDSVLLDHGDETGPLDLSLLRTPGTWRLDADAPPWNPTMGRPTQLVVLDGTWSQVGRMMRRLPALHGMPRLALPPPAPRLRMRLPPPEGMSTLEAVAATIRMLEGDDAGADALLEVYDRMTDVVLAGSGKQRRRALEAR